MRILSWNAVSNGPWEKAFAIGAVLYEDGKEVNSFYARRPLRENINPSFEPKTTLDFKGMPLTHSTYMGMLSSFAEFLLGNKEGADIILNKGIPVGARVVLDLYDLGFIDETDGEFSLIDISGCLKAEDFDSPEAYNAAHGIVSTQSELGSHSPLNSSREIALCYMRLMSR